ncbi:MAG: hypothetical protein MUC28_02065 [Planctomycetes bacterium]|nr:hypothetical protein [Planctomycetota bacterium]
MPESKLVEKERKITGQGRPRKTGARNLSCDFRARASPYQPARGCVLAPDDCRQLLL